jgi:hypothetical protein
MKEKSVLRTLTSTLILASIAEFALLAQTAQPYQGVVGRTLAESKEWWPEPVRPPAGAPNVVWILIDDAGFGASATFGGLIQTPTFDSLATNGLRYTNFHTAAICAPTRAALQVSSVEADWLRERAAAGAPARLVASATRRPAQAFNVVGKIPGSNPAAAPLVVMTPRSGWWTCAGSGEAASQHGLKQRDP